MKRILALALALLTLVSLVACGKEYEHGSEKTVLHLGENKVTEEVYRYFLLNTMDQMADGDENYFTGGDRADRIHELNKKVEEDLARYYAIRDFAKKHKISLSEIEKEELDAEMKALKDSCENDADYKEQLASAYMSEYMAYSMLYYEKLYLKVYNTVADSDKFFSLDGSNVLRYAKENFLFCRHFMITSDDPMTDIEAKEKAEAIKDRLDHGDDYADILQDYEMDDTVVGAYYCFAESEDFVALDEQQVKDLAIGAISEVTVDSYGYHILVRTPVDEGYLEENLSGTVFESYCMHRLNLLLDAIKKDYNITYTEKKAPEDYR